MNSENNPNNQAEIPLKSIIFNN